MEIYHATPSQPGSNPSFLRSAASIVLRAGAGLVLIVQHAWPELMLGWRHIWEKTEWPLVATLQSAGLPLAEIATPVLLFLGASAVAGFVLGILTRPSALVLTGLAAMALGVAARSDSAFAVEATLLYLIVFASVFLLGPGLFAFDAFLSQKKPVQKPKPLA